MNQIWKYSKMNGEWIATRTSPVVVNICINFLWLAQHRSTRSTINSSLTDCKVKKNIQNICQYFLLQYSKIETFRYQVITWINSLQHIIQEIHNLAHGIYAWWTTRVDNCIGDKLEAKLLKSIIPTHYIWHVANKTKHPTLNFQETMVEYVLILDV